MSPVLYIVLPVHDRRESTERFIRCLKAQSYTNYRLILVDDGSTDGTAEMVRRHLPSTLCIRGNGNWWWAGSLQQGFDATDKEPGSDDALLLVMNDDTEFGPEFLETGVAVLASHERSLLMATAYDRKARRLADVGFRVDWRRLRYLPNLGGGENHFLATRGLFLRVRDRREIGNLYPRWLPHYLSDWEFSYRAYRKGFRLLTHPAVGLLVNEETTGHTRATIDTGESLGVFLRKLFSKKSKLNPIYSTVFVLLACPGRWKLQNVGRIWLRSLRLVLQRQSSR